MHRENLSHAFAFCLHGSLKQCLLNFRRESTPAPYNSMPQSPIHLLGNCCVRLAVVKMPDCGPVVPIFLGQIALTTKASLTDAPICGCDPAIINFGCRLIDAIDDLILAVRPSRMSV